MRISVERFVAYSSVTSGLIPQKPTWPLNGKVIFICMFNSHGRTSAIAHGNTIHVDLVQRSNAPLPSSLTPSLHRLLLPFLLPVR